MNEILSLAPQNVWKHFYSLTQIPRPSGHLEKIQAFLLDFGKQVGVESFQDEAGNIIYRKPAAPGMEDRKAVILQAHMDMVPQKDKHSQHDFEKDPIPVYVDGEWVMFRRFMELLAENGGMERSVSAYAEKLCITPKYLSSLSKKVSGRTALSWIHQFTIDAIIKRLRYSNMTIKEISDTMNFPNISFFGKFVKSQTGMSPSEYRRNMYSFDRRPIR